MLATRINAICKEKGTSFAEVERNVGLGNGVIRRWDVMSPKAESLKLVADYLGVSMDYLMCEEDSNAKS